MTRTRKKIGTACVFSVLALGGACTDREADVHKLYFLAGQSNMDGFGHVAELPEELKDTVDGVMIFKGRAARDDDRTGGTGVWAPLGPGFGMGFETDGRGVRLSDRFGPELAFGLALSTDTPDASIALVKYSFGGSGLAPGFGTRSWHPTDRNGSRSNQFDHALRTLRNALSENDIDGDGIRDRLVPAGIIWMQGESDANESPQIAAAYGEHLTQLVSSLRVALMNKDLPVVIGKITDSGMADDGSVMDHIADVQDAQAAFAAADPCAELVSVTDDLGYLDDPYHYDTEGYLRLGEEFAAAILRLESKCNETDSVVATTDVAPKR